MSIAAANATIQEIVEKRVCDALAVKGRFLKQAYTDAARRFGIRTRLGGPDARPYLEFDHDLGVGERELRWLVIQELAHGGVLSLGTFNLCFSHTPGDLEVTSRVIDLAMEKVSEAVSNQSVEGLLDERLLASMSP